jgi:hypothetical protein
MRQIVEREIVTQVVDSLLKAGFYLSVDNGDNSGGTSGPKDSWGNFGYELYMSTDRNKILAAMFLTDEDYLYVMKFGQKNHFAWVRFIYGESGWDVINDHTVNLEKYIGEGTPTQKLIDKYSD